MYYRVQAGDSLWSIAQRAYGTGLGWTALYAANYGRVLNPNLIYAGQVIYIPLA